MRNSFSHTNTNMTFPQTFTPQRLVKCQFLKLLKWDLEFFQNFEKKSIGVEKSWNFLKRVDPQK